MQFVRKFIIDEVCFSKYSYFRKVVIFCSGTEHFVLNLVAMVYSAAF